MRKTCDRSQDVMALRRRQSLEVQFLGDLGGHDYDRNARYAHDDPDELFAGVDGLRETPSKPPVDVTVDVFRTGAGDSNRVGIVLVLRLPAKVNMIANFQPCGGVVFHPRTFR